MTIATNNHPNHDDNDSDKYDKRYWYTIRLDIDKSKFLDPKYAVLEGDILANVEVHDHTVLKRGERCFVIVKRRVEFLHQSLVPDNIVKERRDMGKPLTTGWLRHELYGLQAAIRLPLGGGPFWNASYLTLNKRGIKCLDLPGEFIGIFDDNDKDDMVSNHTESDLPQVSWTADNEDILTIKQSDLQERLTRHSHFAKWLTDTFSIEVLNQGSGVLDVAGGNGKLSAALQKLGVRSCTIVDPKPLIASHEGAVLVLAEALQGDGSALTDDLYPHAQRIRNCSIIVGLHPDEATEAIVDTALRLCKPFAVSPCCVMTKLFPHRKHPKTGDPVRTVWALCRYLLEKAPSAFQVDFLPFAGRNKVIYWKGGDLGESLFCQETDGKDKKMHVVS